MNRALGWGRIPKWLLSRIKTKNLHCGFLFCIWRATSRIPPPAHPKATSRNPATNNTKTTNIRAIINFLSKIRAKSTTTKLVQKSKGKWIRNDWVRWHLLGTLFILQSPFWSFSPPSHLPLSSLKQFGTLFERYREIDWPQILFFKFFCSLHFCIFSWKCIDWFLLIASQVFEHPIPNKHFDKTFDADYVASGHSLVLKKDFWSCIGFCPFPFAFPGKDRILTTPCFISVYNKGREIQMQSNTKSDAIKKDILLNIYKHCFIESN